METQQFLHYPDGDVRIVIDGSHQYNVHKNVLAMGSDLLRSMLSSEHTAQLTKKAKNKGVKVTNVIRGTLSVEDGKQVLHFRPWGVDNEGRPIPAMELGLDLANAMPVPAVITAFEKVLGALYHHPIDIGDFADSGLQAMLPNAIEVLEVAELLECVPIVTQHFEATLLAVGQSVHRSISSEPALWLDLAERMRSKPLYRESMIHAAGQYNTQEMQDALRDFHPKTSEMLQDMAGIVIAKVKDATSCLLSYYPEALQRMKARGLADKETNSRNSYANDVLSWHALSIFRQWLGHQIVSDATHHAADLGYDCLKLLKTGGPAYLTVKELEEWHEFFPMSARGKHVVEMKLDEIKAHAQVMVESIFVNYSMLDVAKFETGYFTYASCPDGQYPWMPVSEGNGDGEFESADDEESDSSKSMDIDEPASVPDKVKLYEQRSRVRHKLNYRDGDFEADMEKMGYEYKCDDPSRQNNHQNNFNAARHARKYGKSKGHTTHGRTQMDYGIGGMH